MQFDNRKTDIAKRYNVDERFLVGCWFTLSAPADSRQTCYQKVIEIKIAQNEYGRIWDLSRPVYIWSSGIASEPEDLNEEFDGMVKYGYRLRVTCLSPGQILRILFVLKKNQASMSSHETWKYALSLRFSDN
jgi:hypothetical protein